MAQSKPIWQMAPYILHFGDPFIEETELQQGHPISSMALISQYLDKLVKSPLRERLTLFTDEQITDVQNTSQLLIVYLYIYFFYLFLFF